MFLQGEAEGKGFLGLHLYQAYSHCERHCASVTHENKHFKAQKFNEINIFIDYQCKQFTPLRFSYRNFKRSSSLHPES